MVAGAALPVLRCPCAGHMTMLPLCPLAPPCCCACSPQVPKVHYGSSALAAQAHLPGGQPDRQLHRHQGGGRAAAPQCAGAGTGSAGGTGRASSADSAGAGSPCGREGAGGAGSPGAGSAGGTGSPGGAAGIAGAGSSGGAGSVGGAAADTELACLAAPGRHCTLPAVRPPSSRLQR